MAGSGRRWVAKAPSPSNHEGASVVHLKNLEFCKRDFGERSNSLLERVLRGEKDGVVRSGQGGVGCGENGGEVLEVMGCFGGKMEEEDGGEDGVVVVVVVGMEEEMEGRMVEELVVAKVV